MRGNGNLWGDTGKKGVRGNGNLGGDTGDSLALCETIVVL